MPAVVTVATIHAGNALNVIPERATLGGTLRAVDPQTRALLGERRARASGGNRRRATASAPTVVRSTSGRRPIVNPATAGGVGARGRRVASSATDAVVPLGMTNMAGEDFAHYMERIPGCFMRIGARLPGEPVIPAHTPRFHAAESSLFVGAAVLAESARMASAALAGTSS